MRVGGDWRSVRAGLVVALQHRQVLDPTFPGSNTVRCWARHSSLLRPLGAVLGATLAAIADAFGVLGAAQDVVANARQVPDASAAHEHDRVLLEVVTFAGDVRRDLLAVRQAHACDLAK